MNSSNTTQAALLVEMSREAERLGLNSGTAGNLSTRAGSGMLITPTGVPAARLAPETMVEMSLDGAWSGDWKPSSEWMMHAAIYRNFLQANAVVHAHPDYCVALSCQRMSLPAFHYMVASFGGDDVRCAEYATFGTAALSHSAVAALQGRTACLLANHGMICFAATLERALAQAVKLETLARQFCIARGLGTPAMLSTPQMREVIERYRGYGQQPSRAAPGDGGKARDR